MNCPIHDEEMRVEHARNVPRGQPYTTGFCLKCLKHYPCCTSSYGTDGCDLIVGHELPHRSPRSMWMDPIPWRQA